MVLVFGSWPVYTLAWLMALLRLPLGFRPTPKSPSRSLNLWWIMPHTAVSLLLAAGLFRFLPEPASLPAIIWLVGTGALLTHLTLIVQWVSLGIKRRWENQPLPASSSLEQVKIE